MTSAEHRVGRLVLSDPRSFAKPPVSKLADHPGSYGPRNDVCQTHRITRDEALGGCYALMPKDGGYVYEITTLAVLLYGKGAASRLGASTFDPGVRVHA